MVLGRLKLIDLFCEVRMKKAATLTLALSLCAVAVIAGGGSGDIQNIIPGVDTLAPQMTNAYQGCGVYEFKATEIRNSPDPPTAPPHSNDQVDKGIASVTISNAPASVNARLILVTDDSFPKDDSYKEFIFRIEPIDPSKKAIAYVWVRDWAGNVNGQEIVIEPAVPSSSDDALDLEARVNTPITYNVTLSNNTAEVQEINEIAISGAPTFSITSGGTAIPVMLPAGQKRIVTVLYTPNLASESGDAAELNVRTPCGDKVIPLVGMGLLGKLSTEDWTAGEQKVGEKFCKQNGFTVQNNGTAEVVITGFVSDNPNVTIVSNISAANPATLAPLQSISVTELCYQRATEGTDVANVTVQCNAEAGDAICIVTASAKTVSSVDPEVLARLNVRYDKSAGRVRFESDASALLYDVHGNVVGACNENGRSIDARSCASGSFFLVLKEDPTLSIPISIIR